MGRHHTGGGEGGGGGWQGTSNNKEHRADTRGSAFIVNTEGEGRKGESEGWGTPKTRLGGGLIHQNGSILAWRQIWYRTTFKGTG